MHTQMSGWRGVVSVVVRVVLCTGGLEFNVDAVTGEITDICKYR